MHIRIGVPGRVAGCRLVPGRWAERQAGPLGGIGTLAAAQLA